MSRADEFWNFEGGAIGYPREPEPEESNGRAPLPPDEAFAEKATRYVKNRLATLDRKLDEPQTPPHERSFLSGARKELKDIARHLGFTPSEPEEETE